MNDFTRLYKKVRRKYNRNKAEWDDKEGFKAFYLKGKMITVVDMEETKKRQEENGGNYNTQGYRYNVMSDKLPSIPCNTHEEVFEAIDKKFNE